MSCKNFLYILDSNPYQIYNLQIFFPVPPSVFSFYCVPWCTEVVTEFWQFFIYSGYKFFIRCCFTNVFSSLWLAFFLTVSFAELKVIKYNLLVFAFISHAFGFVSEVFLETKVTKIYFLFFSRSSIWVKFCICYMSRGFPF